MQNLHCRFVLCSNGQIYGGDFAKICGLLRIYELGFFSKMQKKLQVKIELTEKINFGELSKSE